MTFSVRDMESIVSCSVRKATVMIAAASFVVTALLHVWNSKCKRIFTANVARVSNLYIYPIKSVPGISVNKLHVCRDGGVRFKNIKDRNMVLLNGDKRMITLRHEPKLALISMFMTQDSDDKYYLTLTAPEMNDTLVIKQEEASGHHPQVVHDFTIWSTPTQGTEVSKEASKWFSLYLKQEGVILVKHLPNMKKRPTVVETSSGKTHDPSKKIEYHDGCPIHLINKRTVDSLNQTIQPESSLTSFDDRFFRPNVVIDNLKSKKEEDFQYIRFSSINRTSDTVVCQRVKLCDRCVIPTINPEKGFKEEERTAILRKFRSPQNEFEEKMYGKNPLFGIELAAESDGEVEVGSWIDASYKK